MLWLKVSIHNITKKKKVKNCLDEVLLAKESLWPTKGRIK